MFMLYLKRTIFTLCAFVIFGTVQAQESLRSLKAQANEYYRIQEYHYALPFFLKLDSLKPEDPEINYKTGVCFYKSDNKFKALEYLEKSKKLMHKHHELDLMLAKVYHLHHDFDKAIEHYNHHKRYIKSKSEDGAFELKEMDLYISQCENGKVMIKKPVSYEITNLGPNINSPFPEYSPVISADETVIIYTSRRKGTGGQIDDHDGHFYEDVFISQKEGNVWQPAVNIGKNINTNDHDACIGLSPDGQKMFIYKSQPGVRLAGDIYVSDLVGNEWGKPVKLGPNINTPYWDSHASISADEQTLYYTSDKPGGEGHKDIYVSRRQKNGEWGPAEDLSPKINTEFDEDGPFLHPDGKTLYFSSEGHKSMGGYDIFKSVYNEETKEWSEPENVGYPINTADDDLFFVWSADGTRAYFSSIRKDSYGEKDIYMAHKKEVSNFVVLLKGNVTDKLTKKPVSAVLHVHNLTTNEVVGVFNSNSATGKYIVVLPVGKDFSVTAEAPGYVFHSEHVNVVETDKYLEVEQNIEMEPVGVKDKVAKLNNVFFDYDKATLRPQSKLELDRLVTLLKSKDNFYVEITAHTDSVANNMYNMRLSQERAKTVVAYLVKNGIDSTKLLPVGYGEDFPIATNTTSEGRQLNRRSEFVFVEKFDSKEIKKNLKNAYYYRKERDTLAVDHKIKEAVALKIADVENPTNQFVFLKDNKYKARIYFGTKSSTLSDSSNTELNQFTKLLKENKIQVFVSGYTDNDAGIELSKKRTASVVKYLVKNGIPETQITTQQMGAKNPYSTATTPEAHKLNRRVEILIKVRTLME